MRRCCRESERFGHAKQDCPRRGALEDAERPWRIRHEAAVQREMDHFGLCEIPWVCDWEFRGACGIMRERVV